MECLNECVDNRKKELTVSFILTLAAIIIKLTAILLYKQFNKSGTGTRGQTSWLRKESSSLEDCQGIISS